jgi:L-Ala-D/L-Glu epimerase
VTSSLSVRRVRVPFRVPFETAAGSWRARDSLLLELRWDDGRHGIGEAPVDGEHDTDELVALVSRIAAGDDAGVPDELSRSVAAALGAAVLDAAPGRWGAGPWVGVNATIGAFPLPESVAAATGAVHDGYRTLKLKVGLREGSSALAARVAAVRSAVGEKVALRIDANGTWELEDAVARLRALEPSRLEYVEQPLPVGARGGAALLRRRTEVRVAADEAVTSVEAARGILDAEAADVLVVKPARVGGRRAVEGIAAMAAERGVPVVLSTLFETGIGLAAGLGCAAALPDVEGWPAASRDHGLATADVLVDDLVRDPFERAGGRIRAPGGAASGGLGITPDDAAIQRYRVGRP